jgi:hypothetical protein
MQDRRNMHEIEAHLRTAHDRLMQAQQTLDNRDLNEQKLLEEALDAVNNAQTLIDSQKSL